MKVELGVRCDGMNEADIETIEVPDTITDDELEEMAHEHAVNSTSFDYWYNKKGGSR